MYMFSSLIVGILLLNLTAPFTRNIVTPLSLPNVQYNPAEFTQCTMAGWGGNTTTTNAFVDLKFVNKYVYSQSTCTSIYNVLSGTLNILPSMICAASDDIISSGCAGDNGNPLVCGGIFTGILSQNDGCRASSYPEVYTRVSNYTAWIQSISASPSLFNESTAVFVVMGLIFQFVNKL